MYRLTDWVLICLGAMMFGVVLAIWFGVPQ